MSGTAISEANTRPERAPGPRAALSDHPCFDAGARHKFGRVHLPVAPRCNVMCNFCNRRFDCANESRPGVTSAVLPPERALPYLDAVVARTPNLSVVGIAGPGDPFANPEETMATLRAVHARRPELLLCVATNGLGIGPHIDELAALQVSHVTITVNAVDPEVGARLYAWVRPDRRPVRGVDGARLLLERQLDAIRRLKERGVVVKINSVLVPGINDAHVSEVACAVGELGADVMNVMALVPVAGSVFADRPAPDALQIARVRLGGQRFIRQMSHCARCRADAVGLIEQAPGEEQRTLLEEFARTPVPTLARRFVAVASHEGALVNQHLGEAARLLVFVPDAAAASGFRFVEERATPAPGTGDRRWQELGALLADCRAVLVSGSGARPRQILEAAGLQVAEMEGLIEEGLAAIYAGQAIPAALARRFTGCGRSCKGSGGGCG